MLTRITTAAGAVGVSLAFAGPALAAPSPVPHGHTRATAHHQVVRLAKTAKKSSTAKLYVNGGSGNDENGANTCRLSKSPCATITQAINEAPPASQGSATIEVAGGTYKEQLSINGKNLTINGAGEAQTIIDPTTLTTNSNDPNEPYGSSGSQAVVVEFQDTTGGGLSNLTVNGNASGPNEPTENGCALDYVGVEFNDSSGTLSSAAVTNIQEAQSDFGCQPGGLAVYATNDGTNAETVSMTGITVTKYQKDGIDCDGLGLTCKITGSTVTGIGATGLTAQNGIETDSGVTATITKNTVTGNSYTSPTFNQNGYYAAGSGILVYDSDNTTISSNIVNNNDENISLYEDQYYAGPVATWQVNGNKATAGTNNTGSNGVPLGYGIGDGIDLAGVGEIANGQSNPVTANVYANTVTGNADWGIALFGVDGATIGGTSSTDANVASSNADDGIYIGEDGTNLPSTGDTVQRNTANLNGVDGILADGPDGSGDQSQGGNMFLTNTLANDTRYGAEDLSSGGTGPGGVNNTWTGNKCTPHKDSNPLGLCS